MRSRATFSGDFHAVQGELELLGGGTHQGMVLQEAVERGQGPPRPRCGVWWYSDSSHAQSTRLSLRQVDEHLFGDVGHEGGADVTEKALGSCCARAAGRGASGSARC